HSVNLYLIFLTEVLFLLQMKSRAFILAIIAGFFIFQPGFAMRQPDKCSGGQCAMQNVCAAKKHCENKQSKPGCTSNGCNPFMACWCGNFFMIEKLFSSPVPVTTLTSKFLIRDEKETFAVSLECWHPPEMI